MKILAIVLFMLSGIFLLGSIAVWNRGPINLVGVIGGLVVPGLLLWWGLIALKRSERDR